MAHENNSIKSLDECKTRTFPREVFKSSLFPCRNVTVEIVHRCRSWVKKKAQSAIFSTGGTWEIILSITQKNVEKWRWNLYTAYNVVKSTALGGGKSILRIYSSSDEKKRKIHEPLQKEIVVSTKQPDQNSAFKKHAHTHAATESLSALVRWQVVLVFLSSSVALCCPSLWKEGWFLLCVLFFLSGGSSHGCTSFVLCLGRETTTSKACSLSPPQLERTRVVHVTSHPTEQAVDSGVGVACQKS